MMQSQNPNEKHSSSDKVTVEDLLRLKRAEQPGPEFWSTFNQRLKQRQLAAAIEEKRPWWRSIPRLAIYLPIGATMAVAVGFIAVNRMGTTSSTMGPMVAEVTQAPTSSTEIADNPLITDVAGQFAAATSEANQPVSSEPATTESVILASSDTSANQSVASFDPTVTRTTDAMALALNRANKRPSQATPKVFDEPVSIQLTAPAALAEITALRNRGTIDSAIISTSTTGYDRSFEQTVATTVAMDDAKAAAKPDSASKDPRVERLLALTDMPSVNVTSDSPRLTRIRERVTSRLDDRALTDAISRFGANGESVSIRF